MVLVLFVLLAISARALVFVGVRMGADGGALMALTSTILFAPIPALCATALYYELRSGEDAGVSPDAVAPSPAG